MADMHVPLPSGGSAFVRLPGSATSNDIDMLGQMLVHLGVWWAFREQQDTDWDMQLPKLSQLQDSLP